MTETASRPAEQARRSRETLQSVIGTKLLPPREAGRAFARDHLLARLIKARRQRCVLVQGPAGAGKTTVVAAWYRELLTLGFDVAWLTLSTEDNEGCLWLDYLVASFAQVDPAIVQTASQLAGRGVDLEAIERTLIALMRSIAGRSKEVVLILDDAHLLTDSAARWALQWLLDQSPTNLHFALVYRGVAPASLSRLRSQQNVFELNFQDLRFSQSEAETFLKARLGTIDRRTMQRLYEMTDGWIAGLQLLSARWQSRRDARGPKPSSRGPIVDEPSFASFLEREVLSNLSEEECALLEAASICNRFCGSLCAALLARPEESTRLGAILGGFVAQDVFVIPLESFDREVWYRLHPLSGEVLRSRFGKRDEAEQVRFHKAAWLWFHHHGYVEEAVRHAVSANDASSAAELLERYGQELLVRGEARKLHGLLRRLPVHEIQSRKYLRLWMARSQLFARELEPCAASLKQLDTDLAADDFQARFTLTLLKATLAVAQDDIAAAMSVLPQLLHPPAGVDAAAIGGRNNLLSWLYMHRGDHEQARRFQIESPSTGVGEIPPLGTPGGRLQGRCLVGLSYALEGQILEAERIYRDVLYESERRGPACIDPACLAAALLGEVLYEINDPSAALQLLEDRVDILERVSIPDSVLRVMLVLSSSHWLAGRHQEALSYLDRLEDYATNLGLDRLIAYSLGERIRRHLEQGEFELAKRKLSLLDGIGRRQADNGEGPASEISIVVERTHIHALLALGRYDEAASNLASLVEVCETRGRLQVVAVLQIQRAIVANRRGMSDQAQELAQAGLRLGHRLGLVRSLLDSHADALDLIRSFGSEPGFDPLLSFYVENLCSAGAATGKAPSPPREGDAPNESDLIESLSDRELDIIRLLSRALSNKKIARALSLSPDTVKWHLKNIYGKLGVAGRDDAVARMRDLGWSENGGQWRRP